MKRWASTLLLLVLSVWTAKALEVRLVCLRLQLYLSIFCRARRPLATTLLIRALRLQDETDENRQRCSGASATRASLFRSRTRASLQPPVFQACTAGAAGEVCFDLFISVKFTDVGKEEEGDPIVSLVIFGVEG